MIWRWTRWRRARCCWRRVSSSGRNLDDLVRRTEGWPVGLYLAALAVNAGGSPTDGVTLTGEDRFIGDYLRSEILDRVSPAEVTFLTRTSILDRMCGPLCDAVVGVKDRAHSSSGWSAATCWWSRSTDAVSGTGTTTCSAICCSRSCASVIRMVSELHLRAAAWYEANGMPEIALDHAQAAGDADRVARLVLQLCQPGMGEWTDRHRPALDGVVRGQRTHRALPGDRRPRGVDVRLAGRPADTERWADAAETTPAPGCSPTGARSRACWPTCGQLCAVAGSEAMRMDAQVAWADSARPVRFDRRCSRSRASPICSRATPTERTRSSPVPSTATRARCRPFVPVVLADRGSVAIERTIGSRPRRSLDQALTIIDGGQFDDYWTSALVYAWAAQVWCTGVIRRRHDSSSPEPLGSARCSPTASPWSRSRRCWRWPGPTSGSPIQAAPGPSSGRPTTSSSNGPPWATCRQQADELGPRSKRSKPKRWALLADDRRAAPAAAPADPSVVPGDRGAAVRLPAHGQDPGDLHLPQARRLLAQRDDRPHARPRFARPRLTGRQKAQPPAGLRAALRTIQGGFCDLKFLRRSCYPNICSI